MRSPTVVPVTCLIDFLFEHIDQCVCSYGICFENTLLDMFAMFTYESQLKVSTRSRPYIETMTW